MLPDVSVAVRQKYVARLHSLHFSVGSSFIGCFGSDPPASRSCAAVLTRNLTLGFRSAFVRTLVLMVSLAILRLRSPAAASERSRRAAYAL